MTGARDPAASLFTPVIGGSAGSEQEFSHAAATGATNSAQCQGVQVLHPPLSNLSFSLHACHCTRSQSLHDTAAPRHRVERYIVAIRQQPFCISHAVSDFYSLQHEPAEDYK